MKPHPTACLCSLELVQSDPASSFLTDKGKQKWAYMARRLLCQLVDYSVGQGLVWLQIVSCPLCVPFVTVLLFGDLPTPWPHGAKLPTSNPSFPQVLIKHIWTFLFVFLLHFQSLQTVQNSCFVCRLHIITCEAKRLILSSYCSTHSFDKLCKY